MQCTIIIITVIVLLSILNTENMNECFFFRSWCFILFGYLGTKIGTPRRVSVVKLNGFSKRSMHDDEG